MGLYITPKKKIAAHLRNGAKLIEKHGWVQGAFGNNTVGFCAFGSLGGSVDVECETYDIYVDAKTALQRYVNSPELIPAWNDAKKRTKKDVLSALRGAARWLEHGGG